MKTRSSMFKRGLLVDGTIDAGYRGEILVMLRNCTDDPYHVNKGDRIAQMVVTPCALCEVVVVEELSKSERGEGGYGSTGV